MPLGGFRWDRTSVAGPANDVMAWSGVTASCVGLPWLKKKKKKKKEKKKKRWVRQPPGLDDINGVLVAEKD